MTHLAVVQIAREAAKTAAAVAAGTPWLPQEVEQHVLEWRGLASSLQMEKGVAPHLVVGDDWQKANSSLADLWDSALPLLVEPAFARLCEVMKDLPPAPTIAAGDGVPDMCQQVTVSLASLGAELRCKAASCLDNRRLSKQSGGQNEDRVRYMSNVAQLAVVLKGHVVGIGPVRNVLGSLQGVQRGHTFHHGHRWQRGSGCVAAEGLEYGWTHFR